MSIAHVQLSSEMTQTEHKDAFSCSPLLSSLLSPLSLSLSLSLSLPPLSLSRWECLDFLFPSPLLSPRHLHSLISPSLFFFGFFFYPRSREIHEHVSLTWQLCSTLGLDNVTAPTMHLIFILRTGLCAITILTCSTTVTGEPCRKIRGLHSVHPHTGRAVTLYPFQLVHFFCVSCRDRFSKSMGKTKTKQKNPQLSVMQHTVQETHQSSNGSIDHICILVHEPLSSMVAFHMATHTKSIAGGHWWAISLENPVTAHDLKLVYCQVYYRLGT